MEETQVGFEDQEDCFGAGAAEKFFDVIAEAESVDGEEGFVVQVDGGDETLGLIDGPMSAVKKDLPTGGGNGHRWITGFGQDYRIGLIVQPLFQIRRQRWIGAPERGQIRHQKRTFGQDKARGLIERCEHLFPCLYHRLRLELSDLGC